MSQIALITGTTSGIGEATAEVLAKNGYDLIINGRRKEKLDALKKKLEDAYNVKILTLPFDVRDNAAVKDAIENLPTEWREIDVLVNNAGLGLGLGPINEGIVEDWDTMIDTNVKGLLYVSHAVMPLMIARRQGRIVNLGSIAGKDIYAGGNVYCMTKHAVDAITKSMRIDLLPHNIRVTGIHPGMVDTEFLIIRFKGDSKKAAERIAGFTPLYAVDVAETILFALTRPAHVTINELTVMPTAQADANNMVRK